MELKQEARAEIIQRVGRYKATLDRVEEKPGKYDRPVSVWTFRVSDGPEMGKETVIIAGMTLRVGTSLHQLAERLLGRQIGAGDDVDLSGVIGKTFDLSIIPNGDGVSVDVESIKLIGERD